MTRHLALLTLSLSLCSAYAHANAGTPLMWAGIFHLSLGNALIGLAEGWTLARVYRLPRWKCIWLFIVANYVSAFVGLIVLGSFSDYVFSPTLYNARLWMAVCAVLTYVLTLIVEWPFFWLRAKTATTNRVQAFRVHSAIQLVSYVLLFGLYYSVSFTTLTTAVTAVPPGNLRLPPAVRVLYISEDDGNVFEARSDGTHELLHRLNRKGRRFSGDRLIARPSSDDSKLSDVLLYSESAYSPLLTVKGSGPIDKKISGDREQSGWMNFGSQELSPYTTWKFYAGFWAAEGITATRQSDGHKLYLALETPFLNKVVRNATQIAENLVVFQLGSDQIYLLDAETKRVALLAPGARLADDQRLKSPRTVVRNSSRRTTMSAQCKTQSPFGAIYLVASEKGLQSISWEQKNIPMLGSLQSKEPQARILSQATRELEEYFAGRRKTFNVALDANGTEFQNRVWAELKKIPYGKTCSYGDIAARIKNKGAMRAVGTANGRNPLPIVVPCHRVVAANQKLGGYTGGTHIKKKLLAIEGLAQFA